VGPDAAHFAATFPGAKLSCSNFRRARHEPREEYASDLIELNGDDLRRGPLEDRKATPEIISARAGTGIRFNEHMQAQGKAGFRHACKLGLEALSKVQGLRRMVWSATG
jgi:ATP-dependent DNA ligase